MVHRRLHGQYSEHHGDVVDNGGQDTDQDVGVARAQVAVHQLRSDCQVTEYAQAADTEDDALEDHQCVPLGAFLTDENIKWFAARLVMLVEQLPLVYINLHLLRAADMRDGTGDIVAAQ